MRKTEPSVCLFVLKTFYYFLFKKKFFTVNIRVGNLFNKAAQKIGTKEVQNNSNNYYYFNMREEKFINIHYTPCVLIMTNFALSYFVLNTIKKYFPNVVERVFLVLYK